MPLLVVPHGGPHYSFCNQFNLDHAIFALLGTLHHFNYLKNKLDNKSY
jgi:dipeptidyl aminopeptidase/acylaminoacyl peptidase